MPVKNKLSDLRDHLFETLEALKDPEKPMDIHRAKAIAGVAQTIINSATVEVKAMSALGRDKSAGAFFGETEERKAMSAAVGSSIRHGEVAPPSRVVDPLRTVIPAPPEEGVRRRTNGHA
jgi:hypothetical protein